MSFVAPPMFLQALPFLSQRCHWYWYVIGWSPTHVPVVEESVEPTEAVPEIVGGAVLPGRRSRS